MPLQYAASDGRDLRYSGSKNERESDRAPIRVPDIKFFSVATQRWSCPPAGFESESARMTASSCPSTVL